MSSIVKAVLIVGGATFLAGCGDKAMTFGHCQFRAQSALAHAVDRNAATERIGELTESCMLEQGYYMAVLDNRAKGCDMPLAMGGHVTLYLVQGEAACYSRLPGHYWLAK